MEKDTLPATEESLQLEVEDHPMNTSRPSQLADLHPVLIDGIERTAPVGPMGVYSTRLALPLATPHHDLRIEFGTINSRVLQPASVE